MKLSAMHGLFFVSLLLRSAAVLVVFVCLCSVRHFIFILSSGFFWTRKDTSFFINLFVCSIASTSAVRGSRGLSNSEIDIRCSGEGVIYGTDKSIFGASSGSFVVAGGVAAATCRFKEGMQFYLCIQMATSR